MRKRLRIAIVGYGTGGQASARAMNPQPGQGVNMALLDARALRDALREHDSVAEALALYQRQRRAHVGVYHFWSRWLTPLFQSERDFAARWRDWLFHPMSRMPGARGQMLRVLSGTRKGWLGRMALPKGFVDALAAMARPRELESQVRQAIAFDVPVKSAME